MPRKKPRMKSPLDILGSFQHLLTPFLDVFLCCTLLEEKMERPRTTPTRENQLNQKQSVSSNNLSELKLGSSKKGYRLTRGPWSECLFIYLRWFNGLVTSVNSLCFSAFFVGFVSKLVLCVFRIRNNNKCGFYLSKTLIFASHLKKLRITIFMLACRGMPCFSLPQGFCQSVFCGWEVWNIKILKTKITHRSTRPENQMRACAINNELEQMHHPPKNIIFVCSNNERQ